MDADPGQGTGVTVDEALTTARHVVRVLRQVGTTLDEAAEVLVQAELDAHAQLCQNQAALCRQAAQALDSALQRALAPPPDETPPTGYLVRLSQDLGAPYTWLSPAGTKWLVEVMLEAHSILRKWLAAAEITL